ncbi:histone-fold-containing protein [Suillus clintonianus]|uniref:histone-fold-containing protein n=1 Tax=Suillus clintonianus TaxID=1904413 RepID=UPI001B87F4F7|nr:histone-fold-containing protein [Suillus clintonianus]KAG2148830.1 histone-fold-containing protein [Suillus clintonianus]
MKTKNKQTKFPVARIKKIMQKDEEVGKVAQATPVVISKALELFLAMIVEEATKVTVERGAKKVEGYHLKHAIETTEMLDFLKEIVESVPDPSAGGTIDLQAEAAENAKRKRSKAKKNGAASGEGPKRRRKKKEDADTEGVPEETMGEAKSEEGETRMEDDDDAYEESSSRPRHRRDDDGEDDMPYVPR